MSSFLSASATAIALASTLYFSTASAYSHPGNSNLAVYWGQGAGQNGLASFCQDSTIDIIPIGFVNVFPDQTGSNGYPGTNFGNACGGYYVNSQNETTQLLASCPQIEQDIKYCQGQGKKVLLSLGGGSTGVFVANDTSATAFADFLYGAFGPSSSSWTGPRPFGTAAVDGFDFDIEASASQIPTAMGAGYATMVNHLRSLGDLTISASPQCIVPDANLGDALTNSFFDMVFVQFYNTPQCSARAHFNHSYGAYSVGETTDISYSSWVTWVQSSSKNPAAMVYLGLPASPSATFGDMYMNTTEAQSLITEFRGDYPAQFGGVMLWEATFSLENQVNGMSYAQNIKCFLSGTGCSASTSTTATTSTASPTFPGHPTSTSTSESSSSTTTSPSLPGFPTFTSTSPSSSTTTPAPFSFPHGPSDTSSTTTSSSSSSTSSFSFVWPEPTTTSSSTTSAWGWDPSTTSSTVSPISTSSSNSTVWSEWDPSTTSSSTSSSTAWPEWDPSTTSSSSSSSTAWPEWDPSTTTSTSVWTNPWTDPSSTLPLALSTMTVIPVALTSSTPTVTIASWSSFWTVRGSTASSPVSSSCSSSTATGWTESGSWTSASPVSTSTAASSSSAWSFTGYASPIPISTASAAWAQTSAAAVNAATASPSINAYASPKTFTGAAANVQPMAWFGVVGAFVGVLGMLV